MSGHYPFSGKANRVSVYAFFEKHQLGRELQEEYYKWWYDWAKNFAMNDVDLRATKATEFQHYPYGQHAHDNFHLHDYVWCTIMLDLGELIKNVLIPKLSEEQQHKLEEEHRHMLEQLLKKREQKPRQAPPDVGRYRHV